jgi:hypothetical protein
MVSPPEPDGLRRTAPRIGTIEHTVKQHCLSKKYFDKRCAEQT